MLLGDIPVRVAGADAVRHGEPRREALLAEDVVQVLGQALDRARADAVEHRGQRQLARLPERGHAPLERIADRDHRGRDVFDLAPALARQRNRQHLTAGLERVGAARLHRQPADDGAREHEPRALHERVVEERADVRRGRVDALLVALEAEDLVGIDGERQVGEDLDAEGQHYFLRRRTPHTG